MNCHVYLRNNVVFLPTMGKMDEGFYRGVEPVAVVPASNSDAIRQALQIAIARGNPIVSVLRRSEIPPPVLRIAGQKKQANRLWNDDLQEIIDFPPGTSVDDVIERMITILQDATRK